MNVCVLLRPGKLADIAAACSCVAGTVNCPRVNLFLFFLVIVSTDLVTITNPAGRFQFGGQNPPSEPESAEL